MPLLLHVFIPCLLYFLSGEQIPIVVSATAASSYRDYYVSISYTGNATYNTNYNISTTMVTIPIGSTTAYEPTFF